MTSPHPHERLDQAMLRRRLDLDMRTWKELADAAGISEAMLRNIRRGTNPVSATTAHVLERALEWEGGSIRAVMDGREPTPLPPPSAADVDADLERTEKLMDELKARIGRGLPKGRDRELDAVMQILHSMAEESARHTT